MNEWIEELADLAASVNAVLDSSTEPLVESRQLFGTLTSLLPELALVHTDVIIYANDAAAAHFGLEPDALIGKAIVDVVRPAYRAVVRKHVANLLVRLRIELLRQLGHLRSLLLSVFDTPYGGKLLPHLRSCLFAQLGRFSNLLLVQLQLLLHLLQAQ